MFLELQFRLEFELFSVILDCQVHRRFFLLLVVTACSLRLTVDRRQVQEVLWLSVSTDMRPKLMKKNEVKIEMSFGFDMKDVGKQ